MIGASVEVRGVDAVVARLQRVALRIGNRRIPNKEVSVVLFAEVMRNFDAEAHEGKPWAPLAPATVKGKEKKGYARILQNTGALRNSFLPFSDADVAGVGARSVKKHADISTVHEYGAPERNIPARPMLPSRLTAERIALKVYELYVERSIK